MIVAGGNSGAGCASITRQPGRFRSVITIGATGFRSTDIAPFSSRGPVTDGTAYRKPDLCAPGVQVVSAVRNNGYATYSGTSMATPGVAGALALFWSAVPSLQRNINATLQIFERTALHQPSNLCSSNGTPNNVYGHGSIDVFKAYEEARRLGY